jgi:predicted RNase H-like HicB family nuclease
MKKNQNIMLKYLAVFNPAKEGGYDVSFPAFPGCVTFGKTFEDAKKMAKEVLEIWLEEISNSGEEIISHNNHPIIGEISAVISNKAKVSYASACR